LNVAGVVVETLDWTRWFDVAPPRQLQAILGQADVEVIQIWGPAALRCVGLLRPSLLRRAVYSPPLPRVRQLLDRWLLSCVGCVIVRDETEKTRALALGVPPDRAIVVP